ncbi:putative Wzz domain-containing protein [Gammaproteobacteria bacterium]
MVDFLESMGKDLESSDTEKVDSLSLLLATWDLVLSRKKLAVRLFLGTVFLALAFALFSTPIYKSEALLSIVVDDKPGDSLGLGALAGLGGGGGERGDAIAVLDSHLLAERFIKKNQLMPVFFEKYWDENRKTWKSEPPTFGEAFRFFVKIYEMREDRKAGTISLSIRWKDPVIAADWANKLIQEADSIMREEAIEDARKSIAFLESELQKTNMVEVKQSIQQIMDSQIKQLMLASTKGRYAYKVLDPPTVPDLRDSPKRAFIVVLSAFLGLILAISVPILIEKFHRIRSRIQKYREEQYQTENNLKQTEEQSFSKPLMDLHTAEEEINLEK